MKRKWDFISLYLIPAVLGSLYFIFYWRILLLCPFSLLFSLFLFAFCTLYAWIWSRWGVCVMLRIGHLFREAKKKIAKKRQNWPNMFEFISNETWMQTPSKLLLFFRSRSRQQSTRLLFMNITRRTTAAIRLFFSLIVISKLTHWCVCFYCRTHFRLIVCYHQPWLLDPFN